MAEKVKKRLVFYISGFDPRGVRHYYQLYKREAQKQAVVSEYKIEVGPRKKNSFCSYNWEINFKDSQDNSSVTDYHFLDYGKLIRDEWRPKMYLVLLDALKCYYHMIKEPIIYMLYKLSWPSALAACIPLIIILLSIFAASIFSLLVYLFMPIETLWLRALVALGSAIVPLFLCHRLDRYTNHYWITRSLAFICLQKFKSNTGASKIFDELAAVAAEKINRNNYDEVIIVGHSVGSVISVEVSQRLLGLINPSRPIELVTLGGLVSTTMSNPLAVEFSAQVIELVENEGKLRWSDAAARTDGVAMCDVHPYLLIGKSLEGVKLPVMKRLNFFEEMSAESYQNLKKDRIKFHFQYLLANEGLNKYDYFKMTAGCDFFDPDALLHDSVNHK